MTGLVLSYRIKHAVMCSKIVMVDVETAGYIKVAGATYSYVSNSSAENVPKRVSISEQVCMVLQPVGNCCNSLGQSTPHRNLQQCKIFTSFP
jgi:hypothetical protein